MSQRFSVTSSSPSGDVSDTTGGPKQHAMRSGSQILPQMSASSEISRYENPPCFVPGIRFLGHVVYCKNCEQDHTYTGIEEERNT